MGEASKKVEEFLLTWVMPSDHEEALEDLKRIVNLQQRTRAMDEKKVSKADQRLYVEYIKRVRAAKGNLMPPQEWQEHLEDTQDTMARYEAAQTQVLLLEELLTRKLQTTYGVPATIQGGYYLYTLDSDGVLSRSQRVVHHVTPRIKESSDGDKTPNKASRENESQDTPLEPLRRVPRRREMEENSEHPCGTDGCPPTRVFRDTD